MQGYHVFEAQHPASTRDSGTHMDIRYYNLARIIQVFHSYKKTQVIGYWYEVMFLHTVCSQ